MKKIIAVIVLGVASIIGLPSAASAESSSAAAIVEFNWAPAHAICSYWVPPPNYTVTHASNFLFYNYHHVLCKWIHFAGPLSPQCIKVTGIYNRHNGAHEIIDQVITTDC